MPIVCSYLANPRILIYLYFVDWFLLDFKNFSPRGPALISEIYVVFFECNLSFCVPHNPSQNVLRLPELYYLFLSNYRSLKLIENQTNEKAQSESLYAIEFKSTAPSKTILFQASIRASLETLAIRSEHGQLWAPCYLTYPFEMKMHRQACNTNLSDSLWIREKLANYC